MNEDDMDEEILEEEDEWSLKYREHLDSTRDGDGIPNRQEAHDLLVAEVLAAPRTPKEARQFVANVQRAVEQRNRQTMQRLVAQPGLWREGLDPDIPVGDGVVVLWSKAKLDHLKGYKDVTATQFARQARAHGEKMFHIDDVIGRFGGDNSKRIEDLY